MIEWLCKEAETVSRLYRLPSVDRDDLLQELLIVGIELLREERPLLYIKRAMRNKAVDFLRSKKREERLFCNLELAVELHKAEREFIDELLELELKSELLSQLNRSLFLLLKEGHSITESAGILKIPVRQASRLLDKLRRFFR